MFLRRTRHGCRAGTVVEAGHTVVVLENAHVRVAVLPHRGAQIVELRHKATDVDLLWRSPWPALPAGIAPPWPPGPGEAFLDDYLGGWQEMFPSCGDPTVVAGGRLGVHGEATTLPWTVSSTDERDDRVVVTFTVETRRTPFRLERRMTLLRDASTVQLHERATNLGRHAVSFAWGHHPTFGAPFLEEGCELSTDAATVVTHAHHHDDAMRLQPGRTTAWPHAVARDGTTVDLSAIPGPDARSHDWAYLTDFREGWVALRRPRDGLGVAMRWDTAVMPHLLAWQQYGGASGAPWFGRAYVLGLEPLSLLPAAADAARGAPMLRLDGGDTLAFTMTVTPFLSDRPVHAVDPLGAVA